MSRVNDSFTARCSAVKHNLGANAAQEAQALAEELQQAMVKLMYIPG